MLTLSKLAALAISFALTAKADPSVQPVPETGTVFCVYPGWDMDNGSIQTIYGGTELACFHSCCANTNCNAFAYVPYGSMRGPGEACYLKYSVDLGTFKQQSDDVSVGLIGSCGTFTPVGPTSSYTISE